jgi:hypothetical protein
MLATVCNTNKDYFDLVTYLLYEKLDIETIGSITLVLIYQPEYDSCCFFFLH